MKKENKKNDQRKNRKVRFLISMIIISLVFALLLNYSSPIFNDRSVSVLIVRDTRAMRKSILGYKLGTVAQADQSSSSVQEDFVQLFEYLSNAKSKTIHFPYNYSLKELKESIVKDTYILDVNLAHIRAVGDKGLSKIYEYNSYIAPFNATMRVMLTCERIGKVNHMEAITFDPKNSDIMDNWLKISFQKKKFGLYNYTMIDFSPHNPYPDTTWYTYQFINCSTDDKIIFDCRFSCIENDNPSIDNLVNISIKLANLETGEVLCIDSKYINCSEVKTEAHIRLLNYIEVHFGNNYKSQMDSFIERTSQAETPTATEVSWFFAAMIPIWMSK